jgi:uncharacterized repeat protein (TIGR01451 family)
MKLRLSGTLVLFILLFMFVAKSPAFGPSAPAPLPSFDKRTDGLQAGDVVSGNQRAAVEQLRLRLPLARVDFDPVTGAPKMISAGDKFLSGTNGQGRAISAATAAGFTGDPHRATKAFLREHRQLFGYGPEVFDKARVKREFVTPHNGMKTVVWEQQVDAIPVFEAVFISHTTREGELVNLSSQFVPDPEGAADWGVTNRAALVAAPSISARKAVTITARNVGEQIQEAEIRPDAATNKNTMAPDPEKRQAFKAAVFKGNAEAKLVWLPMSKTQLRLCWDVVLMSRTRGEMFRVLVDVQTGEPLLRRCLTDYLSEATYRVYTSDSPSPFSPGYSTPTTSQPPLVSRTLLTLSALDTNASPAGWINDGGNETLGNNVDAHTDRNADDVADLPRPQGSPFRVFDFPLDLTQVPSTYTNAAVVQLFYWNNFIHDKLYELGFTEAAGNFQSNNFSRGGLGNDAVQADAQDGSGVNNANFSTPPDGSPGRMQMYLFTGPSPARDGDLDAEVILHEYTHGLSNRRVGGGVGISALQSAGMGEGWSDFYAMALLSEPGDDMNGVYAYGGYATYQLSGLTQNYYFGIRRYPYCTDTNKNPLTFKDIDPAQANAHTGVPRSPIIGTTANEVHNMGEVWCMTLREARANLINKYGWAVGNQLILQLVTDGMNLSPANPNFLQARDAILQADQVDNGGADLTELWAGFAKRGMGKSATSPSSSTTTGLQEAYDVPFQPLQLVVPASATEGDGVLAGAGQVHLPFPVGTNVVIALSSSDTSEATVPATVTIPAGQTNAVFDLTIIDDGVLDGTQTSAISASASGFANGYGTISVFDNETATLQAMLPATAAEGQGTVQGTVQVSAVPAANIVVSLSSSDTTEIQVPASVTIPSGQTSAVFTAIVVDDNQIDGSQTATVTAHVQNWTDGSATITVLDNESLNLTVTLPASAPENAGVLTNAGSVSISGTLPTNLLVSLVSGTPVKLTVPSSVTISAGQVSKTFNLTLVDNSVPDGHQTVTVTASAPLFTNGSASIFVIDDESPPPPSNPRPGHLAVNVPANTNLMWNNGTSSELVINGGFETGTLTNWVLVPGALGHFAINNGSFDPPSPDGPLPPYAGSFSALAYPTGPGIFYMYQDIPIPSGTSFATLSWAHRVRNFYSSFSSSQQFQVQLCDTNNNVLAVAFTTNPGDPLLDEWVQKSYDLTPFAGQKLRVRFWVNPGMYFLDVHLDNVSVQVGSTASGITNDVYFGTNPTPGPAEFKGSTTNSSWTLPLLSPLTTYYWQIVAHKGGTATGPVWQFTTKGVDHFVWAPVTSPQLVNQPFGAAITAKDAFNTTVSNFNGSATLSATGGQSEIFHVDFESGLQGFSINNTFGSGNGLWHLSAGRGSNPGHSSSNSLYYGHNEGATGGGNYDTGTANGGVVTSPGIFLPPGVGTITLTFNYLMNVESLASYDQAYVEVSTNNGASYIVVAAKGAGLTNSTGGQWVSNSVALSQFAGSTIWLRLHFDTIDSIANSTEGWYLDDIVIRSGVGGGGQISLTPTNTGAFTAGVWSGSITVQQLATNVVLHADDGNGHTGSSNPFDVAVTNDISISILDSPNPVSVGASLTYTLTVANTGPSAATGVSVTNLRPASTAFISAISSQGTCTQSGGVVTCALGVVPGGTNATITIVVVPTVAGTTLTNSATVSRVEVDPYLGNNAALATTVVTTPAISIADASVAEGNVETADMIFAVTLAAPSAQTITVNYATVNGSATAGGDYISTNGILTFPPGITNGTIAVKVIGDTVIETNETFFVNLSGPVNGTLGRSQGVGTIVNDDGLPGQVDHFTWSVIASPQYTNVPFGVTIAALDFFNNPVTNFNGTVALSGSMGGGLTTNTMFGNITHSASYNFGTFTIGHSFTPNTNILVTHIRHYSGTKVSIWTDAGILLASQNVISVPGSWVETPLLTPVQLLAGQRYRIGLYTGGMIYYGRFDQSSTFSDGTIDQAYEISGDGFPNSSSSWRWIFVDLRYTGGSSLAFPITPTVSGNLTNGIWNGNVAVLNRATNAMLVADDGNGHTGLSNPFDVVPANMAPVILAQPTDQTVIVGGTATFTVVADGTPPLSCQWNFNGTNIVGATNATLALANVQLNQAGNYAVLVTNLFGSILSSNAVLTVNLPPPVPVIFGFNPISGSVGTSVTIVGTNFSPVASDNIVYFGAVRAVVNAASMTNLVVTVPAGAVFAPITVTVNSLTAYANNPFLPTFPTGGTLSSSSLSGPTNLTAGSGPGRVVIGDLDGDGKPDMVVADAYDGAFYIYRNISTNGTLAAASFASPVIFTIGGGSDSLWGLAVADVDGDGRLDIVVLHENANQVMVLRNLCVPGNITTNSFAPPVNFSVGSDSRGVAVQDLDGDGKPEIVVANWGDSTVSVLRNIGTVGSITTNSFAPAVNFATGPNPQNVAIADLDGDGKPDVVSVNNNDGTSSAVSVLRNISTSGNIAFAPEVDYPGLSSSYDIAIGDLDGDGKLDLAVSSFIYGQAVSVYRNVSTPGSITTNSFAPRVDFDAGGWGNAVAIGDLDGDGKPDVAVVTQLPDHLSLFKNTSTPGSFTSSSFAARVDFSSGWNPNGVAIGDLDGDGRPDIIFGNCYDSTISIYQNVVPFGGSPPFITIQPTNQTVTVGGTASFSVAAGGSLPLSYQWNFNGTNIVGATNTILTLTNVQLNQAGNYAVLVTNLYGSILSSNAMLTVNPPPPVPVIFGFNPISGSVGTSVTISGTNFSPVASNNIVYFGAVRAMVSAASVTNLVMTVPVGATYAPITETVNGLTAYANQPFMPTFSGDGSGITVNSFGPRLDLASGSGPIKVVIADLDGDGKPDLIVANDYNNSISLYRNISTNGSLTAGSFAPRVDLVTPPGSYSPFGLVVADVDGDGKLDIIVSDYDESIVSVYRNTCTPGNISSNAFATRVDFATGAQPQGVEVRDLDGDGKPDLLVANNGDGTVSILRNTGVMGSLTTNSFAPKVDIATGSGCQGVAAGDLDGDGKPDVVTVNSGNGTVSLLRNISTPGSITTNSFAAKVDIAVLSGAVQVAIGDLDGDGKPDLTVTFYLSQTVSVLRNTSTVGSLTTNSFAPRIDYSLGGRGHTPAIADLDGDGKPDLAVVTELNSLLSIFRNVSTPGSFTNSSLAGRVDYVTGWNAWGISVGDLDGDGRPDVVFGNSYDNTISIYQNATPFGEPPVITAQPTNQMITVGGTASFSVTADGTPPLSYQWNFNGTNILGAANTTLTLTNVQVSQAGNYTVLVTNLFGSVLSSNAILVVTLDHFAWNLIPSPRFVNTPFSVIIRAQDMTNGLFTNFTGTAILGSTNGIAVTPPVSGNFIQGVWTGAVVISQTASNLVLRANDGLGHFGLANPINVISLPRLGMLRSGNIALYMWPVGYSGFVLETSGNLSPATWVVVPYSPIQIGDQYLLPLDMTGTNGFYRLRFPGP